MERLHQRMGKPTTHRQVIAMLERAERESPGSSSDTIEEMRAMKPDARGLISYANGYATLEVEAE